MTMTVRVQEMGQRPGILTKARQFAPQAAKVLGELFYALSSQGTFGHERFGDAAFVVLDWSNETGQLPDGSVVRPILYLQVQKRWQDGKYLRVDSRIDVDEVFSSSLELNRDLLTSLVVETLEKVAVESEKKGK